MQQTLLPPPLTTLPGLKVAARFLPSRAVGGDFYDYFTLGDRCLVIYMGDVQGKGLEAAMYALLVSGLMRGLHKSDTDPASVIAFLNHRLCFRALPGKFCCLNYAVFDLEHGALRYANAGLPFPFLLRQGSLSRIELPGLPVGILNPCDYDQLRVDLRPGDRLLFYTDGVPDSLEAFWPARGDGEAQVQEVVRRHADQSASALADRLVEGLHTTPYSAARRRRPRRKRERADDATFLVIQIE